MYTRWGLYLWVLRTWHYTDDWASAYFWLDLVTKRFSSKASLAEAPCNASDSQRLELQTARNQSDGEVNRDSWPRISDFSAILVYDETSGDAVAKQT